MTAWKVSVFGVILARIFPHLDWIRRDTVAGVSVKFLMVGVTNSMVGYHLMTEDHSIQLGSGERCLDFFDFYWYYCIEKYLLRNGGNSG